MLNNQQITIIMYMYALIMLTGHHQRRLPSLDFVYVTLDPDLDLDLDHDPDPDSDHDHNPDHDPDHDPDLDLDLDFDLDFDPGHDHDHPARSIVAFISVSSAGWRFQPHR